MYEHGFCKLSILVMLSLFWAEAKDGSHVTCFRHQSSLRMLRSLRLDYGFKQKVISNLTGIINKIYGTLNNPHTTPLVSYSNDYCSMGRWKMGQNDCSSGCHKHITAINKMSYLSLPSHVGVTHHQKFF